MIPFANLALLSSLATLVIADEPIHIPLVRRSTTAPRARTPDEWNAYREAVTIKFTPGLNRTKSAKFRRQNAASIPLTNLGFDTTYFAQVSIGTPGTQFNVILDTGSSDLWVAGNQCQGCGTAQSFNPSSSSSAQTTQQPIDLQYGSGEAQGLLTSDTVSMGGFTVSKQQFVTAQQVSQGLLQGDLSGLLGLGFNTIAQTQATPFVQALAQGTQLKSQEMSFFLDRLINVQNAQDEAPGGTFTIGGTNTSLFQGDIDFVNLPSGVQPSFWLLPVTAVGIQGTTLNVNSGTQSLAAIDTGTTLIGGPTSAVTEIYSKIQGSQPLNGQMQGYFSIPCNTQVSSSFTFSSKTWTIDPDDFIVQQIQGNDCLGAIFGLDLGSQGGPDWVIGDTFLKNVYSVFRFSPGPSVGFAQLASNLEATNTASTPQASRTESIPGGPLPPTDGPTQPSSSGGSNPFGGSNPSGSGSSNPFSSGGGAMSLRSGMSVMMVVVIAVMSGLWIL